MPKLVALDLPGGTRFVDALRAVWDAGDAAAPLDPRLSSAARRSVLDALRPTCVVHADGERRAVRGGVPVEEGDALVVATSGTSGHPKGVVLTHQAVGASAVATTARLAVDPARHTWLACLPLAHIGGLSVVTRALATETPLLVLPGFEAGVVEEAGRSGRATHVSLVATALRRLDPSVFASVLLGGSRPPEELPDNVVTTYGMTETGSGVVYDGIPLSGVEVAIRALGEERRGRGAPGKGGGGEILLRAPMLFRGYRDGASGRVRGPDGAADWFATGDAGCLDADGRVSVWGRLAEVITTGAEMVWPDAVERALSGHRAVAEVAVWKRPDPEWGERVVAWVVPSDEIPLLEELRELVAEEVAPWAAPKELVVVDHLPRSATGKIRRAGLDDPGADPS